MRPCLERSGFLHSRYDNAGVVEDGLLVRVKYASVSSLVVTSHSKKFCGKMVIIIVCHFFDEG